MKRNIQLGVMLILLMCFGFTMYSYDVADDGVKLISEDDMVDLLELNQKDYGILSKSYIDNHNIKTKFPKGEIS